MVRGTRGVVGVTISAQDGDVGRVEAVYFDDQHWTVRYLVVDAGDWHPGRRVLISPVCVRRPEWERRRLPIALTRAQVQASPEVEIGRPLSRPFEAAFCQYYGVPAYWRAAGDRHLRSTEEVCGYALLASDGRLGHVDDVLIEDLTWRIRYLDVATNRARPSRHVLVAPEWIDEVNGRDGTLVVPLSCQTLRSAPPYDPARPIDREFEKAVYAHYGILGYWDDRAAA